jgi:hypothetical protein
MAAVLCLRHGLLAIVLVALMGTVARATPFVNEIVDGIGTAMGECNDIAMDSHGNPHVSYSDDDNHTLMYAVKIGGVWRREVVPGSEGVLEERTSIALDSHDQPHIIYWKTAADGADANYAAKIGGAWVLDTLVVQGNAGDALSIAVDANDVPHCVYKATTNYAGTTVSKVFYTYRVPYWPTDRWAEREEVDTFGGGAYPEIAIDAKGRPHVGYVGLTGGISGIRYAVRNGGAWSKYDVEGPTGGIVGIALDPQDRPHLSYQFNSDLHHAYNPGNGWVKEPADTVGWVGEESAIAVDASGVIHISHFDGTNSALHYASKRPGQSWTVEIVDAEGYTGCYTNIVVDHQDVPHIIHYDDTNEDFKYASAGVRLVTPFGGEFWAAGSAQEVVWQGSGVVDLRLSTDGGLTYETWMSGITAHRVSVVAPAVESDRVRVEVVRSASPYSSSSSAASFTIAPDLVSPWWETEVDLNSGAGYYANMKLDSHDNPRVVYKADAGVKYAAYAGGQWYTDVAVSGSTKTQPALALGADGTPHVSYYESGTSTKDLYYATRSTSTGWSSTLLDASNDVGLNSSIVVGRNGKIHISYFDNTSKDLKYIVKSGGSWSSPIVIDGSTTVVGSSATSIAVDIEDYPHVAYWNSTNKQLSHAWQTLSGWHVESIAPGYYLGSSLCVGPDGTLHVAYVSTTGESLYHARRDHSTWIREFVTLDECALSVRNASIAVDGAGNPSIAFQKCDGFYVVKRANGSWVSELLRTVYTDPGSQATDLVGQYNSLAIDSRGAARVAYSRYASIDATSSNQASLLYASSAIELTSPGTAASWPVGARRTVNWNGTGKVDVYLSTNGGLTYDLLSNDVRGGSYRLTVPSAASEQCKVKVERRVPHSVAVSDSFFTIESDVMLTSLKAAPAEDGVGVTLTWSTNPGPEDLEGYRLERRDDGSWATLASKLKTTSYRDRSGTTGSQYRLYATNGMHDEILLGESSIAPARWLAAWPTPVRGGVINVSFASVGAPGGGESDARVTLHDVSGRLVRVIVEGRYRAGIHLATWDGRDREGERVRPGVYFLQATCAGHRERLRVAIVR